MEIKKTALHAKHLALKAQMAPFAGYEMPIQYTSVKDEVMNVRQNIGVFDVSHMGEFFIVGEEAHAFADYLIPNDVRGLDLKKAVYSPLCRENGTCVDDLIMYKLSEKKVLVCMNASNVAKDWAHMKQYASKFDVEFTNQSENYSLLAVQGPKAVPLLEKLGIMKDSESICYYSAYETSFKGENLIIARTGYTGEDGVEIFCSHQFASTLWDMLMENGATPCGLASRDVLRLEACYPLYGHELTDEVTPLDSGLKWTIKLQKSNFVGKMALQEYKPKWRQVKLSVDKVVPRQDYPIENSQGETIGHVTSGTFSPTINRGIAMCHIGAGKYPLDEKLFINIRNKKYEALIHKGAFVAGGHK